MCCARELFNASHHQLWLRKQNKNQPANSLICFGTKCIRRRLNPCQLSVQTTTCSFILPFRWSKQHELQYACNLFFSFFMSLLLCHICALSSFYSVCPFSFGICHFLCLQLISSPALSSVPPSTVSCSLPLRYIFSLHNFLSFDDWI